MDSHRFDIRNKVLEDLNFNVIDSDLQFIDLGYGDGVPVYQNRISSVNPLEATTTYVADIDANDKNAGYVSSYVRAFSLISIPFITPSYQSNLTQHNLRMVILLAGLRPTQRPLLLVSIYALSILSLSPQSVYFIRFCSSVLKLFVHCNTVKLLRIANQHCMAMEVSMS